MSVRPIMNQPFRNDAASTKAKGQLTRGSNLSSTSCIRVNNVYVVKKNYRYFGTISTLLQQL